MIIPEDFLLKIKEYRIVNNNIDELVEERKSKTVELKLKVSKIEVVYKEKILKLEETKEKLKKFIITNWQKYISGKKISVDDKIVKKVGRVEIEVVNKEEVIKLLSLMQRLDIIKFDLKKIRELVNIGSIPETYIKKLDKSYITFTTK